MPYDLASPETPILTDEEAWDVAAFINSQPRPSKIFSADWPDISTKPYDHPLGPYADNFSEQQHKFGPFAPIKAAQKKSK
jgi:thiosulfate dehydrogenase